MSNPNGNPIDLNILQKETMGAALHDIFKAIGENHENLVFADETEKKEVDEKISKVAMRIFEILVDRGVFHQDLQMTTIKVQGALHMVFEEISKIYREYEKEYLARNIKAINPANGKYSREYATIADLFGALHNVRKEQDVDGESKYFFKEEPIEEEVFTDDFTMDDGTIFTYAMRKEAGLDELTFHEFKERYAKMKASDKK